jgi:hypothetical protein
MMTDWQRACVYTCMIGDYEKLNEQPIATQSSIPFLCLTDNSGLQSSTWRIVRIDPILPMDPVRSQRMFKLLPHRFLPDFELSLYIDNSVILKKKPEEIFDRYLVSSDFALPIHSFRDRLIDEFVEVAKSVKDDRDRISEQLDHYRSSDPGALDERPYWSGIQLRRHDSPGLGRTLEVWAAHVLRYSRRDQLSANTAFRLTGVKPLGLDIDNLESWFHSWPHVSGRTPRPAKLPNMLQEEMIARHMARIGAMESSRSWRLTAPLRRLRREWSRWTGSARAASGKGR